MAATNVEVWQRAVVLEVKDVAMDIRRIVLSPSLPKKADPGSHIDLKVSIGGEEHKRSYSVVEADADGSRLVTSVMKAPQSRGGSEYMHALEVGDVLEITQPLQNFPLRLGAPRYVLLAGGIGITAIANMARVLRGIKADYTFVYAGRNEDSMAYLDELREVHGDRLRVHVDEVDGILDVPGLVSGLDEDTELYMCGPIRLMDAVRRAWIDCGLSLPNLRYETFGNSGWHDPEDFIVRIPRLNIETTVGRGRSMLEALEDAGADLMFDCRKGECGLCEVRILSLEGGLLDHRDVFYSERQQRAVEKMCCCVSRAVTSPTGARADADPTRGPAIVTIDVS